MYMTSHNFPLVNCYLSTICKLSSTRHHAFIFNLFTFGILTNLIISLPLDLKDAAMFFLKKISPALFKLEGRLSKKFFEDFL